MALTWDDPGDGTITGYVILRRNIVKQDPGKFTTVEENTGTTDTAYTDDGVEPETRYAYRIRAINAHGISSRSGYVNVETTAAPTPVPTPEPTPEPTPGPTPEPPASPTGLSATASHDQVTLSWDDPGDDSITGYVILRRNRDIHAEGEFTTLVEDTGAAATTYTDDTVEPETPYTYRIKAINEHGESERSRWFHIDTPAAPTPEPTPESPAEPPASPTGLAAEVSHDSVTLTWDDPGDDSITGYVILRRDSAIHEEGTFETVESDTGSAETAYTDDSAQPERKYVYRIKAINKHGLSEISSWVRAYTPAAPVPAAPTGLSATASYDQVVLTWDDPGDGSITGYVILRRNRDIHAEGEFTTLVEDTGTAATTYTDGTVEPETPYTYRIKAINEHGESERSRWFHIATPAAPDPAGLAPSNLTAATANGPVVLSWDAPVEDVGSVTGYEILRGHGESEPTTLVADTGSDATTHTDVTATQASQSYTYLVKALRGQDQSQATNEARVQLPPGALRLVSSAALHDSVLLTWDDPQDETVTGYRILRRDQDNDPAGDFATIVSDTVSVETRYTDDTVEPERTYVYRVLVISAHGTSPPSHDVIVSTPATPTTEPPDEPPAMPTGLLSTEATYDTVTLTWDDPQDDSITGYVVVRWALVWSSSGFTTIAADTGTADTSYTDETVEGKTEYLYYIKAINALGESEQSEFARAKTPAAPDPALLAPANLAAEPVDGRVSLSWDAPVEDAASVTGYEILRARGEDELTTLVADTGSAATAHIDATADAPGESYAYRVKAIRNGKRSQASEEAAMQLPGPPPAAPSGLTAQYGSGGIVLVWNAPAEDAASVTGYEVLRAQGEDELTTLVADTGNAATAYTHASVNGFSESYAYRVRAVRDGERSPDSNEARLQLPPARPTGVGSAVSSDTVMLIWANPPDDSITGYRILRRDGDAPAGGQFTTIESDTGSAATTYTDDTVEPERVYVYRVLAISPQGISEPSRDVEVSTTAPQEPLRALPGQQVRQNISEPSGDDFAADGSTQGRLEVDGSVTGNIASNGDQDAFAVELVQDRIYRFDLEGSETEQGTLADPAIVFIFLLDSSNNVAPIVNTTDFDSGEGENSRLTFTLPSGTTYPTGTYYILVGEEGGDATGTYRLTMTRLTDDNKRIEAQLEPGDTVSGTFDPFTWYYFALDGLTSGRYTLSFSKGAIEAIYAAGNLTTDQPHGAATYTFDVRSTGTPQTRYVWLVVRGDAGSYTVSLDETMLDLVVGGSPAAGRIRVLPDIEAPAGGPWGTSMQFFPVELEAGVVYQVDIKGVDTGDGTLDYPMLANIAAPDGSYVGGTNHLFVQGGGEGRNVRYVFTADQDGTYFLKAGGALWSIAYVDDLGVPQSYTLYRAGTFTVSIQETEEAPSCTLNRGDLWCGVITVGSGTNAYGYDRETGDDIGDLSGTDFDVGTNSYTIISILVDSATSPTPGALSFVVHPSSRPTAADRDTVVLQVGGRSDTFAFSDASVSAGRTFRWFSAGLDWSGRDYVIVRLRQK